MSEKKAKYITTTLPYVNADPHIGFAYEIINADALARYWRLLGDEVFFNTGTDEHGQKIAQKADEKGESRQAYVDHFANEFRKLGAALNLSEHAFIRTTIAEKFGAEAAENVSILYGGSCKPSNAKEIFAKPDVDGGLIGGAALKCADFKGIIDAWKA